VCQAGQLGGQQPRHWRGRRVPAPDRGMVGQLREDRALQPGWPTVRAGVGDGGCLGARIARELNVGASCRGTRNRRPPRSTPLASARDDPPVTMAVEGEDLTASTGVLGSPPAAGEAVGRSHGGWACSVRSRPRTRGEIHADAVLPFREMGRVTLLRWQQTWQLLARHRCLWTPTVTASAWLSGSTCRRASGLHRA
jgi:hypothetical protein